jgi:hypothetical protein
MVPALLDPECRTAAKVTRHKLDRTGFVEHNQSFLTPPDVTRRITRKRCRDGVLELDFRRSLISGRRHVQCDVRVLTFGAKPFVHHQHAEQCKPSPGK